MSTRALNVHVTGPIAAADHETVTLAVNIVVGFDDASNLTDVMHADIPLKTLGVYKTPLEMNQDVVAAVKQHLLTFNAIPTNGYAATYVSGAYGSLTI